MREKTKKISLVLASTFVSVGAILLFEYVASKLLKKDPTKEAYPLFYSRSASVKSYQQNWGDELVVSYVDPLLGFAHNHEKHPILKTTPGFSVYRSANTTANSTTFRIVALGGSTTDPLTGIFLRDPTTEYSDPYNWPKSLFELFDRQGTPTEVRNGGVAGYSSSQEFLKLARDVVPLEPHLVLCLDGVNDAGFFQSSPQHPLLHRYQVTLFDQLHTYKPTLLFPNITSLLRSQSSGATRKIEGVSNGIPQSLSPSSQWERNIRMSHAIAQEFGIEFIVFLQPVMGFGDYRMSKEESKLLSLKGEEYLQEVRSFYSEAKEICREYDYCVDLTDIFSNHTEVYLDPRHQNRKGVEILAKEIYNELKARNLDRIR